MTKKTAYRLTANQTVALQRILAYTRSAVNKGPSETYASMCARDITTHRIDELIAIFEETPEK